MIRKLRRKFIQITMTSVFAVLFLIIAAINGVNIYQNNKSTDSITQMLFENDGAFRKDALTPETNLPAADMSRPQPPQKEDNFSDRFHNRKELPFSTRFFTIRLDFSREILSYDLSSIASVNPADLDGFAETILDRGKQVGWVQTYRYRLEETNNGYFIIVMEATMMRSSILSVLAITLTVGLFAFLIVFALVALFSKRAILPISETYDKQRQFITDASHELKTPLTVIAANTEILSLTYGENEWCEGILRQSGHMRSLINQMIQMSKLDEGKQTLVFENFNLSDAVYDTALSFSSVAAARNLTLETDIAPEIFFCGNETALRQVVAILTDNAVKYCDEKGRILVSLKQTSGNFGREKLSLCVRNTFCGAAALNTGKLFERFYRADQAHTAGNSYGLGLSIAKSIVEHHRGKIEAVNVNGEEIAFSITFQVNGR